MSSTVDELLEEADSCVAAGDYRAARRLAQIAGQRSPHHAQRLHIARIRAATGPDRVTVIITAVSGMFLLLVVFLTLA